MTQLTISIPAYNDAPALESLVRESIHHASQVTDDFEVLVIDDGSRDDTPDVLRRICQTTPRVRVHTHPQNLGFGPTIREVFVLPRSQWVFFIPGDGQIPPSALSMLYSRREQADLLLGHRRHRSDSWGRRLNSWCYNLAISLIARQRIRDVNSGGLLRRAALEGVALESRSAFIHAEIALEIVRHGGTLREIPIEHRPRTHGRGSGSKLPVILATVADLGRYLWRRAVRRKTPPVGLTGGIDDDHAKVQSGDAAR